MSDKLKYYTDKSLDNDNIFHGFFTRQGGVSEFTCAGLNCGIGSDDDKDNVHKNRELVAAEASGKLLSLYQIHSPVVLKVDENWSDRPRADGYVTDKAGLALSVLTADCTPVLFFGEKDGGEPIIGAAHAGWRGALGGVLENTVSAMVELGAVNGNIRACIGPCISKSSYEVGEDFPSPFIEEHEESERFFQSGSKAGHLMFDLSGYCAWRLFRAGLKNIAMLDIDTYSNEAEFFSFRRATHRKEKDYGRQISVVCIK